MVVCIPRLDLTGYDELIKAFDRISEVPDEITEKALLAMGEVAAEKIRSTGNAYGVHDPNSNVHVLDKVKINKPKKTDTGGYADVTFSGTRTRGGKQVRNAEIAFLNEYGKKNQAARPFVGEAMTKNEEQIIRAGAEIIQDWFERDFQK